MDFTYKHTESGEIKTLSLTEKEMANLIDVNDLHDEFCKENCNCQPVGETNVVDCNCDEYLADFELQES